MPLLAPPGTPPTSGAPIAPPSAVDADPVAVPTLCRTKDDELFVSYHSSANHLRMWLSRDLGGTWTDWSNLSDLNYQFPRAVVTPEYLYLAFYWVTGGGIRVIRSRDFGLTFLTGLNDSITFTEPQAQLPSLRVDRSGILHLVFWDSAGGHLVHRYVDTVDSLNKDHWTAPTNLIPTFGTPAGTYVLGGANRGILTYHDDTPARTQPRIWGTIESYDQLDVGPPYPLSQWIWPTVAPPPATADSDIPTQYYGTLIDHAETIWVAFRDAGGTLRTYASDDDAQNWTLLPG